MLFFQSLKKIRKEKKIKIKDIAEFLGKSRQTISLWENGKFQPGEADIRLMAQFLNVNLPAISDLKENKLNHVTEKKEYPLNIDVKGLPQDVALKVKELNESCITLRTTNARQRSNLFKYEILLQSLPFMIYVKDKKLKYTYANESFLHIISRNYSKESIFGMSSFDIFGAKEYFQILELEQQALQTKQKISGRQIYIPGSYKQKIGLLTIIPSFNDNEEIEEIICSIKDVTDAYEEENRRKDLEAVIDKMNYMVWIGETVNGDEDTFKYTHVSDNISRIYGVDKIEYFRDNRLWLKVIHKDDIAAVKEWMEIKEFPKKTEYRINTPNGTRWVSNEVFKEGVNKFYGIVSDITEEKKKENEREAILRTLNVTTDAIKIAKIENTKKEYVYVNCANKNLYELPVSKIKNNPEVWKEYVYPEDKIKYSRQTTKVEGQLRLNYRLLFPDGKIKYIEENIFREIVDGVLYSGTIKRDVTEEKESIDKNEIFALAYNKANEGFWIYDENKKEHIVLIMQRLK